MDFCGDLYGQTLRVDFLQRLRDAVKFASVDELVGQMHRDIADIRTFTAKQLECLWTHHNRDTSR